MAVAPICYKLSYKDQFTVTAIPSDSRLNDTDIFSRANIRKDEDVSGGTNCNRRSTISHMMTDVSVLLREQRASRLRCGYLSRRGNMCMAQLASEPNSNNKQLKALDSYFGKLQNDASQPSYKRLEISDTSGQFKAEKWLGSLNDYLAKETQDRTPKNYVPTASEAASRYATGDSGRNGRKKLKNYVDNKDAEGSYDETSDLYLISILVSIDIAVFLFEIASPIRNSDLFSLPLMYGAKVNDLIIIGEWWRLLTPMFLHSGILHVALGCWVLLTFGPQVSRVYGSFTFFLIYVLGGISGNMTSFLHTPEPTVGGTGPVFAIIGAWLIYQIQNRDVTAKDVSESMFQKAMIATALSSILSNFGPIDDWTHFGAALTGVLYGFLTCPTLQVEDTSKTGQEEGITLVRRYADPCKSLIVFSLFVLLLSSLVFVIDPPLNSLASDISV